MSYVKKRVLVISTGGTIMGNVATDHVAVKRSDVSDVSTVLDNAMDIIKKNWNIEVETVIENLYNIDSSNVKTENWKSLVWKIQQSYDDFDAFIVLHGTNTMGYTSTALTFAFENINKPIIITGAQVPLGYLGSDAVTNLVNSLRLAVWHYHEIKWVMVVFGSRIITGSRAKKWTDFDYDPFQSFQSGTLWQIGRFIRIDEARMRKHIDYLSLTKSPALRSEFLSVKADFDLERIASLTEFPNMPVSMFQVLVETLGIRWFIFRSFGAGDPSAHLFPAFHYLREQQIPIVVTTQAPGGVASFQVNETGQYLRENGLAIPAFDMSIESMTIKLGWLLWQNESYESIQSKMIRDFHGEIVVENELL